MPEASKRRYPGSDLHEGIPGHWELLLQVYQEGHKDYDELLLDPSMPGPPIPKELEGRRRRDAGYSLAKLRQTIGGQEGYILNPQSGERHFLSLKPWANADPETTRCYPVYRFVPDQSHEEEYQARLRRYLEEKHSRGE